MRAAKGLRSSAWVRLSPYVQPRVLLGNIPLSPANLTPGPDRHQYLEGLLAFANSKIVRAAHRGKNRKKNIASAVTLIQSLPFASELLTIKTPKGRSPFVEAQENARLSLAFDLEKLSLTFLDGRDRRCSASLGIASGAATSDLARLVSALANGISSSALAQMLRTNVDGIENIILELRERKMIEETVPPEPRRSKNRRAEPETLTWLGHAGVSFSSGETHVWVDPLLRPRTEWSRGDKKTLFSARFSDSRLMPDYGRHPGPRAYADLPTPKLVCITHQDVDHFDLGTLMMLPASTPIVVPAYRGQPWEVDLKKAIHKVLGRQRKVIALGHGKSVRLPGGVRVTAFPFEGEMPASMPHLWNCYLIETNAVAVACMADAAVTGSCVDFLARKLRGSRKRLTICSREPHDGTPEPGYRDSEDFPKDMYSASRLWGWYLPPGELFEEVPRVGVSRSVLKDLRRRTKFTHYFAYATGSTPWFRIMDETDTFNIAISSMSADGLKRIMKTLAAADKRISLFPAQYGIPVRI